jgi:hypothetical protein
MWAPPNGGKCETQIKAQRCPAGTTNNERKDQGSQFRASRDFHSSSVAVTGTWSDGRNPPRRPLRTCRSVTRAANSGATQM